MSLPEVPSQPRATYRVQLHGGFTFEDAAGIVDYLADLGISHLYCSPYLQAVEGSTHGYDVVDHDRLNDELGGADGHARMSSALAERGLGQILDVVPNHMATAGRHNRWWWDVLENGPSSRYARYFDIDWDPPVRKLIAQVLVPVLGDHYGRVLERGELLVARDGGSFVVRYFEHELPVSPRSADRIVMAAAERLRSDGVTECDEVESVGHALGRLPHALVTDRASVGERHRDKEVLRQRLASLCAERPEIAAALDAEVEALNRDVESLHDLLERQNYRLAFWRTAGRELDYRRFFDVTTLVALRAEEPEVFEDTHALVLRLVRDGVLHGLRIDHIDGLRDPQGYLERLRHAVGDETYLVVEKILEGEERLRPAWPVDGTSGYDFLAQVNQLLHDPGGEKHMTAVYERWSEDAGEFEDLATTAKHEIMRTVLATDVERLTEQLAIVAEQHRRHRDYTRSELRDALRELIASFHVYRTYVRRGRRPEPDDVALVAGAAKRAADRRPDLDPELLAFVTDLLLLEHPGDAEVELAERFQQVSAPVMAKAVEDTAFYRYLRQVSLNEVGGDPGRFGMSTAAFHRRRQETTGARSMLGTSTHDTKRSEDVRARLAALSEVPEGWQAATERWEQMNAGRRPALLDRPTEYLLYQTAAGAWPLDPARAVSYMEKATREAKAHTSWIDPAPDYDQAVASFTEGVVSDPGFAADLSEFLEWSGVLAAGRHNSLVQTALKLTCPGVPDLYQGTELWDLSLVDPDNRRPVDYDLRRRVLEDAREMTAEDAMQRVAEGVPKLWLIRKLLALRNRRPELFVESAGYSPLPVEADADDRTIAFGRGGALAVLTTRLSLRGPLGPGVTVQLPAGRWESVLTSATFEGRVAVRDLVEEFPVAVLVREDG